MTEKIRGHFFIRTSNNTFQMLDMGTPESDTAIVQALRATTDRTGPDPVNFGGASIEYWKWQS